MGVVVEEEGVVDSCGTVYVEIEGKGGGGVDELDCRKRMGGLSGLREKEKRERRRRVQLAKGSRAGLTY